MLIFHKKVASLVHLTNTEKAEGKTVTLIKNNEKTFEVALIENNKNKIK
jgi:hypothetical protein